METQKYPGMYQGLIDRIESLEKVIDNILGKRIYIEKEVQHCIHCTRRDEVPNGCAKKSANILLPEMRENNPGLCENT